MVLQRLFFFLIPLFFAFPDPLGSARVQDFANVIQGHVTRNIEGVLEAVERETTAQVAVVTIPSLDGLTVDEYANKLFNQWGIGKGDVNNGVLFLIAPNEKRTRIEVGYGLEPLLTDALSGEILDQYVIPYFKLGKMQEGIEAGANEIARILRAYPQAARGVPGSTPAFVTSPRKNASLASFGVIIFSALFLIFGALAGRTNNYSRTQFLWGLLMVAAFAVPAAYLFFNLASPLRPTLSFAGGGGSMLLALFYNMRKYRRYGPRRCKQCGSELVMLGEAEDDQDLTDVQRLEESIGSVDYDVWFCPACLSKNKEKYISSFSGYSSCPKCAAQTYKEVSTTEVAATTYSTGTKRIDGACVSCPYKTTYRRIIPRVTRSSSSSSSSGGRGGFGGGRSGGGGASRGW